jgi:hypothetical protein
MNSDEPGSRPERPSPWLAVTLLTIALVAWFGFQTYQLVRERAGLQAARASQEPTIEQAQKLRTQLDAISKKTLELAKQGNAGATLIVEELARRGVTINPSSPAGPAPPAPSK